MFKTLSLVVISLFGLILITVIYENSESEEIKGERIDKTLKIGYCKTFERYAQALAKENSLEIVKMQSAAEVLSNLNSGKIDYAVIGRRAYSFEIQNHIIEKPLEKYGWTLVGKEKGVLLEDELKNFEIHTYLEKEDVLNFSSLDLNFILHDNIDTAFNSGDISLISWEDFQDEFQLIVIYEKNSDTKIETFRTPMLYINENAPQLETKKVI